ncbi:recombinase family protein [Trichocoleus sp. DQ-A3]|uniref:recombinase family protein n=1 Tax=Cyanophyceae TaxID=3028117 RepID=UPI00168338E9|nr:recombinase family protein [Coleofasciculus sp. FACHB-125]MBD1903853.1 recombinase family protein [Coleofasciculus sp. FACHB-125]
MGQLKLYRVAIYCRVSTDEQSCERRERDLVSYVQLSGFEVVAVYFDAVRKRSLS